MVGALNHSNTKIFALHSYIIYGRRRRIKKKIHLRVEKRAFKLFLLRYKTVKSERCTRCFRRRKSSMTLWPVFRDDYPLNCGSSEKFCSGHTSDVDYQVLSICNSLIDNKKKKKCCVVKYWKLSERHYNIYTCINCLTIIVFFYLFL